MFFGGEFDGFLIMIDTELGVMVFAAAVDKHHGASITGFDVMDVVGGVIIVGCFKLFFVVVDKTDGFVVADNFDVIIVGIAGNLFEIKIFGGNGEFIIDAVFEPVAFPTFIPTFDEEAADAEFDGVIDIFFGVLGGGTMTLAWGPGPLADVHSPPDADEFESFDPAKVAFGRVV